MSERTDTKLRETKFFFQSLVRESDKESPSEPEAFLCVFKFMNEQRRVVVHWEGSPDVELVWVHVPISDG
jgi:hypothetical protein